MRRSNVEAARRSGHRTFGFLSPLHPTPTHTPSTHPPFKIKGCFYAPITCIAQQANFTGFKRKKKKHWPT